MRRAMSDHFAGFERIEVQGVPVLLRADPRFKAFRVALYAERPMAGPTAARAMLPGLLVEGTTRHPDRPSLVRAMEWLYGAQVLPGISRVAETSILRLSGEAVAGDFLPGAPDQWAAVLDLLADFACRPRLEGSGFPAAMFAREQQQAAAAVRSSRDDKGGWARRRALELGCAGEPYGVPGTGTEAEILALRPDEPEAARHDYLARGRRFAIAMGALPAEPGPGLQRLLEALPDNAAEPLPPPLQPDRRPPRQVIERDAMQQARQVLLLRVAPPADPARLCALHVAVNLWGGGPHSRLFRVLREAQSLCYHIGASCDAHKGIVVVQAGLDAAAAAAAEAGSLEQLAALQRGGFEDDELRTAIATIAGPLQGIDDSLQGAMSFAGEQWLLGFDQTPAERLRQYLAVDRSAVVAALAGIWHDFSYLLAPEAAA